MNKEIASANKIISFGQFKRNWLVHQDKIKNVKSTLTTRPQQKITMNHRTARQPFGNTFNRMIDIQFQNKALLKKLTQRNKQSKLNQSILQQGSTTKLVKNNRKKYYQEYERRLENEGLLKRIKDTKTKYKMETYATQRKVTQKYINSISKFGLKGFKPNKTMIRFQMSSDKKNDHSFQTSKNSRIQANLDPVRTKILRTSEDKKEKENMFLAEISSHKNSRFHKESDLKSSRTSNYNSLERSHTSVSMPILSILPERKIKIGGKIFVINGKQKANKITIDISSAQEKNTQTYVHQVQISKQVYFKRFQGNYQFLLSSIDLDKKSQNFFIK